MRNPIDRLTHGLPRGYRLTIDWLVTILGAIAIVIGDQDRVVNPYRIPSSSMEPTLHCATPDAGCEAGFSDRVLACRFCYRFWSPKRGDIIVFKTPPLAAIRCGAGGTFVKRLIGLPGDTWAEHDGYVFINGTQARRAVHQAGPARHTDGQSGADPGRAVLLHGRQPELVVRLARVGDGPAREPDRQGLRDLLAAEADPDLLGPSRVSATMPHGLRPPLP